MHRTLITTVLTGFLIATAPSSLLDRVWLLVSSFWNDSPTTDEGCGWDPDGRCTPKTGVQDDTGLGWESIQNVQAKAGCGWDPDGRCIP